MRKLIHLFRRPLPAANAAEPEADLAAANSTPFALGEDRTRMLVPYGDFPVWTGSGTGRKRVMQRVDKASASALQSAFNSLRQRLARAFKGTPIYVMHPDAASPMGGDHSSYGWTEGIEVGEDAVAFNVRLNRAGQGLMDDERFGYHSPHWGLQPVPGAAAVNGLPVYSPAVLYSIGLTNAPNIPVPAINTTQEEPAMTLLQRIAALFKSAAATDDEAFGLVEAANARLGELETAQTELAAANTRVAELEPLQTQLDAANTRLGELEPLQALLDAANTAQAAERDARISLLADGAIRDGKIRIGQRTELVAALNSDFDGTVEKLKGSSPLLNLGSQLGDLASRGTGERGPGEQIIAAVNARLEKAGLPRTQDNYNRCWMEVRRDPANAHLFA